MLIKVIRIIKKTTKVQKTSREMKKNVFTWQFILTNYYIPKRVAGGRLTIPWIHLTKKRIIHMFAADLLRDTP